MSSAESSFAVDDWPTLASNVSRLPSRLRLLCVGPDRPSWVNLTLQLDAEGCLEPQFRWVCNGGQALKILRDESFDCVLVLEHDYSDGNMSSGGAIPLLRAIRASGCDDPLIYITAEGTDENWAEVCDRDCELLVTSKFWESSALVSMIKRAMTRNELLGENRRLAVANYRRLVRERDEAEQLLSQQRKIAEELQSLIREPDGTFSSESASHAERQAVAEESAHSKLQLPAEINDYYQELLRTYVIMGSGNLGGEISQFAELLCLAEFSPRDALELHLQRVEDLVRGLGCRSARHVMARADLLALELMIHLGGCYQRKTTQTSLGDVPEPDQVEETPMVHKQAA